MTSSLVGSEMCIRDRKTPSWEAYLSSVQNTDSPAGLYELEALMHRLQPVSYTHLTLPTICSV
eukprot:6408096-Prorocentrum_lima.AAC.1